MYSETFMEIKLLRSPFLVILQTFFTRRALKRHLSTPRALQVRLGAQGTRALEGKLDTRALKDT